MIRISRWILGLVVGILFVGSIEVSPLRAQNPKVKAVLKRHSEGVTCLAFSPDGNTLATGGWDKSIRLWNVKTGKQTTVIKTHTTGINCLIFSPDGRYLVWGGRSFLDNTDDPLTIRIWDLKKGKEKSSLPFVRAESVAYSPDGKILAAGGGRIARLWDTKTEKVKFTLNHIGGLKLNNVSSDVHAVNFSPDGKTLATGSGDHTIRTWNVALGFQGKTFNGGSEIFSVEFSPDGKTLASGNSMDVDLWDLRLGKKTLTLRGHKKLVSSLAFRPDGNTLVSASHDRSIRIWDIATGNLTGLLMDHTQEVTAVAFSPDGTVLATASHDKTVRLWSFPKK